MRNFYKPATNIVLVFLGAISITLNAQTPGKIIRDGQWEIPPVLPGSFLLDPNGDGFVSVSTTGFTGGCDIGPGCSEINYRFVPVINGEILADLRRGPTGQYSEIVPDANGRGLYVRFDGSNILGRLRIGSTMSGAKGYSILVDADGKFGATGPNADPDYSPQTTGTNGNPGYEFEIVLRSAFGVAVYYVNNSCSVAPTLIYENTSRTASIVSIASTTNNNDPDYFYDFHVPLTSLNHGGFTVNASTPLRIQTTTVMSPQGAICGPKSDVYGRDTDFGTATDQFEKLFASACPFTLTDITDAGAGIPPTVCTAPPIVNTGIATTATSITGTWTKASYSTPNSATIVVYKNGNLLGTIPNVATGSTWALTGITVAQGDLITATAQSSGECICENSNTVRVVACTQATTSACPVVTCATGRGLQGTGVIGATIRVYRLTGAGRTLIGSGLLTTTTWSFAGGTTGNNTNICGTGNPNEFSAGTYLVTQQEPGKCETGSCPTSIVNIGGCTLTETPVVNQLVVLNNTANLTGTTVSGAFVRLFLNGAEVASQTASGVNYSFPLSAYFLNAGDVLAVSAQSGTLCNSTLVSRTVSCFIAPPVITASESGFVASGVPISGISSAPAGTIVSVFNNATNALLGTATVIAGFTWATSFNAAAGTSYYATQSTGCGSSGLSAIVTATTPTSAARCGTIASPVLENAINVTGTLSSAVANTLVRLFIDGALVGEATTSTINWSIPATQTTPSGVVIPLIFAGGVLTVEVSQPNQIGVTCPGSVTVQCIAPLNTFTFSITPNGSGGNGNSSGNRYIISGNSFTVTVNGTQNGVLYTLEDETGVDQSQTLFGSATGAIVFSNVTSPSAPGNYNWRIKATKPGACAEVSNSLFLQQAVYSVSGIVRNDTDGLLVTNTVDGLGTDAGGLNAVLVNNAGNVVAVVPVSNIVGSVGTFTFNGVQNGTYTIQLNTGTPTIGLPVPPVSLPLGWVTTGEFLGTTAGNDGLPANSILSVTVAGAPVANAQLGIQQPPIAGSGVNSAINPGGTTHRSVPPSTFTNGDGTTANPSDDPDPGKVEFIRITATTFPANATSIMLGTTTYYANVPGDLALLTAVKIPTDESGNPAVDFIKVDPVDGPVTVSIPFKSIDDAGAESANTGTAVLNFGCVEYRSAESGTVLFSLGTSWEENSTGSWVVPLDGPPPGVTVRIRNVVKLDEDYGIFNCPLILEPNLVSSLIVEPDITLNFDGGADGNAYFNNRPVVVRSTTNGTGAIGEMIPVDPDPLDPAFNASQTYDAENVQLERHLPYSSTPPINKRRWNLLTPGLINGDVMNTTTTLRDAWAGGNQPRVTRSNNRAGSTVYALGNPGFKPQNVPWPLLVAGPDYTPYTGTIITGNRFTNMPGTPQAADDGFDWWDELIIPQGATFYTSPSSFVISNATRTTPSSIRPYRPGATSDFGPERGVNWVSNSTINSDPLKGNKSIVELELDELDNGYMLFTRGDRRVLENWVDSTTLRPVGKIRTGNVPFTVNASPALTVLPNPYPAPISLEKLFTDPDNEPKLGLTAHIWNSNFNSLSNNYGGWITLSKIGSSWVSAPATAGNLEIISSSQAFMVEGGTGGTVTFKESMKANLSEVNFLPFETEGSGSSEKAGVLVTNFNNRNSETNALSIIDGAGILLHNKFTSAITDANDVKKVFNFEGGRSLSILRGGTTLVFDAHPDPVGETVFPLQASQLGQSKFAFTFHPTDLEKDGREAWLRDKFLGTETPISLTSVSQYNFEGNADAASIKADRFEIVFKQSEILPVTFTSINAVEQGKNIKVSWNVATEDKMSHYEVEHSTNGTEFGKAVKVDAKNTSPASYNWLHIQPGAGDHFYRVRAFNLEGRSLLTKVVKVTLGDNAPAFKAFPTVVSATRQVTLQLISLEKGSYTLQVSDMTGKVISARTIEHNGGSASMIMQMPASLSAGKYNIRLTGTSGNFVQPVVKD